MFSKPNKSSWVILGFVFIIFVLAGMSRFVDLGGDSAQYIILAKSLSAGDGLRAMNYPGRPLWTRAPLFPLLLSPFVYFFGTNLYVLHGVMLLFSFLFLSLIYRYLSGAEDADLLWLLAMVAFNFVFLFQGACKVLTEIPFAVFALLSLLHFERAGRRGFSFSRDFRLSVLFLVLAYFTRHIAVTIYLAFVLWMLRPKEIKKNIKAILALTFIFLFCAGAWHLRNRFLSGGGSIGSYTAGFFLVDNYYPSRGTIDIYLLMQRLGRNLLSKVPVAFGIFIFPFAASDFLLRLLGWAVFAGWAAKISKKCRVADIFFLIYSLFVLAWSSDDFTRYFLPFSFLIVYYFYYFLVRLLQAPRARVILRIFMVFIFSANIVFTLTAIPARYSNPYLFELYNVSYWLKNNVGDKTARVAALKPTVIYFYSGLQAMRLPFSLDADGFWRGLEENGISYLVIDNNYLAKQNTLAHFLSRYSANLDLLYAQGKTAVFKIKRPAR